MKANQQTWVPANNLAEAEYWIQYRRTIELLTKRTEKIFKKLLDDGVIADFTETKERKYDIGRNIFRIFYECSAPNIGYKVYFRIRYELAKYGASIKEKSDSRLCNLLIASSAFEDEIADAIINRLEQWSKGSTHEKSFEEFLRVLCLKYASYAPQGFHASARKDKKEGIDFIVRFFREAHSQQIEIPFNLKSSATYLSAHQKRYPNISTFVFNQKDLQYLGKLESRFIRFIIEASKGVAHG